IRYDAQLWMFMAAGFRLQFSQVACNHLRNELLEARLVRPAEFLTSLHGIADQQFDFSGAEVPWVDTDQGVARLRINPLLVQPFSPPDDATANDPESPLYEFPHSVRFARRENIVVGLVLLQHEPHAFDIVAGVPPIALRIEVPDEQRSGQPQLNGRNRSTHLPRNERFTAKGAFV